MNEVIILHSRLNPFRVKLKPSYEIDWGTSGFGEGKLSQREKRPVELFDVKEFVKIKKRNKLFEALDSNKDEKKNDIITPSPEVLKDEINPINPSNFKEDDSNSMFNPFNNSIKTNEEGASFDTISTSNDDKKEDKKIDDTTFNPMFDINENNKLGVNIENKTASPKFDIDSIVKRIDAKIAELEAEEQKEKAANNNDIKEETTTIQPPKENDFANYDTLDNTIVERFDDFMKNDNNEEVSKEEPIINIDNDSVIVGDVTDDEYFDDFFNE